ncbi:hypothetical protein [Streptomyces rubradiris]|uniref:hypothetical protein n=1 Tax=Streptomyces rubradiris TaxID=285531 RepID=UPI00167193D7|nr:hypothetical protein [Streptomyces rubradiris]
MADDAGERVAGLLAAGPQEPAVLNGGFVALPKQQRAELAYGACPIGIVHVRQQQYGCLRP